MRAFIDTNIFVYATYPKFPQHEKAVGFLKKCLKENHSWYLSWHVLYEYLKVVTHPNLFSGETILLSKAIQNVEKFCSAPNIEILQETPHHLQILEKFNLEVHSLKGNILYDVHTVILMKEHDLKKIYTADTDFHRFQGVEVTNPIFS